MNVLALDASADALAVGLLRGGRPAGQVLLALPEAHSRIMVRVAADLLRDAGLAPRQLELLVVAAGPGSYTGLRLAAMAAKVLAWSGGAPVVGVDSLAVRAAPLALARPGGPPVAALIPARRGQLFGRLYDAAWPPAPLAPLREGAAEQVIASLHADARDAGRPAPVFAGEGALAAPEAGVAAGDPAGTAPDGRLPAPGDPALHLPQGLLLARLGLLAAARGEARPALAFLPAYAGPPPAHAAGPRSHRGSDPR